MAIIGYQMKKMMLKNLSTVVLGENEWKKVHPNAKLALIDTFKSAKQSEKKYSEQDLIKAIELAKEGNIGYSAAGSPCYYFEHSEKDIIESITTSNKLTDNELIDFEVEMEYDEKSKKLKALHQSSLPYEFTLHKQPKVINGVLQGKWVIGSSQILKKQ